MVALLLVLALPSPAPAAIRESTKLVTVVARECPSYDSIFANRARNNIQESLKDLGPDTEYSAGEALTAEKEARPPQDACAPITNWRFTLGTGYQSRAVTGKWGSLSKVTNPFADQPVTKASVPLLNDQGQKIRDETIAGAKTFELTAAQAKLAANNNSLWIQGGTTTDPVLDTPFPDEYGFGALRCAIDDLNGDNVEWIAYPTGARHVFCFAYYVKPPPTSGTIIVRKAVDAPAGQPSESFPFTGNISFTPDGSFKLAAAPGKPGSATFYRAGGSTWDFTEAVPPGWRLTGISCTSKLRSSTVRTDVATGRTEVDLQSGDEVTCTYADRLVPPVSGLLLRKITRGGTGAFDLFADPVGGGGPLEATARTTEPGVAADAQPAFTDLAPGAYDVREDLPDSDRGAWRLEGITCDGRDLGTDQPARVTLTAGAGSICTFENRFTPKGTIKLRKSTRGGTGTTGFDVESVGTTPPRRYLHSARTTEENRAVLADGDDTGTLPLDAYEITETGPASGPNRAWRLNAVACNGVAVPAAQGSIRVVLTEEHPDVDCTFFNERSSVNVLPETVSGGGGNGRPPSTTPRADLRITKRPGRHRIRLGERLRYFVTVTNRGPAVARAVTLVEQVGDPKSLLSASPKKYRCSTARRLPGCVIGTLRPGQRAKVVVLVRPRFTGRRPNRAVVNSATAEVNRRNNVTRTHILVRGPRKARGCRPGRFASRARAASRPAC